MVKDIEYKRIGYKKSLDKKIDRLIMFYLLNAAALPPLLVFVAAKTWL
jgi:hypothetical protein